MVSFFLKGIEIVYEIYNPTIQTIEVLKLEKRLDDNLTYLQDCPAEYSTIPFDFAPVKLPPNSPIPINTTKVFRINFNKTSKPAWSILVRFRFLLTKNHGDIAGTVSH